MKNKSTVAIGFVGINTGTVTNSYSSVSLKARTAFGFCSKSTGSISCCFSDCSISAKETYGFLRQITNSDQANSGFYNKNKLKSDKAMDPDAALDLSQIESDFFTKKNWDLEETWKINEVDNTLALCSTEQYKGSDTENEDAENAIEIATAQELLDFCNGVNANDKKYAEGKFVLKNDIDLEGKKWTPVGRDDATPFSGGFDGQGHKITNFIIDDTQLEYAGFFGICKNAHICNLELDCKINSDCTTGGFAAVNENSEIICCGITVQIKIKKTAAAFVFKNSGRIDRCYAAGKIEPPVSSILLPFAIMLAVFLGTGGVAVSVVTSMNSTVEGGDNGNRTFPAVQPDARVLVSENEDHGDYSDEGGNSVTLNFKKRLTAPSGTGDATIFVENPAGPDLNQYVVIYLQMTDAELISKIGKTGRTVEEQAKYEEQENYDTEACRVQIAQSGAVYPGYKLETIELQALPDGTVLPQGDYNAILYFEFYDVETNIKASVAAQSAVILSVSE